MCERSKRVSCRTDGFDPEKMGTIPFPLMAAAALCFRANSRSRSSRGFSMPSSGWTGRVTRSIEIQVCMLICCNRSFNRSGLVKADLVDLTRPGFASVYNHKLRSGASITRQCVRCFWLTQSRLCRQPHFHHMVLTSRGRSAPHTATNRGQVGPVGRCMQWP